MKSNTRSVLKQDLFIALIMVGTGLLSNGVEATRTSPLVSVTIGVLIIGAVYLAEHDVVPGLFPEVATIAAFLVVVAVGAAFVVIFSMPTDVVSAAALTGGGVGLVVYRTAFGLVRPVPGYRLEKQE